MSRGYCFGLQVGIAMGYTKGMKTAISIPDPLFAAVEKTAAQMGVSRSYLFQLAMSAYLRQRSQVAVTAALDEIYAHRPESSGLDPALAWMQGASMVRDQGDEDW